MREAVLSTFFKDVMEAVNSASEKGFTRMDVVAALELIKFDILSNVKDDVDHSLGG